MNGWHIWLVLALSVFVTLFTTLHFALRIPSRARLAERFEHTGKTGAWERFVLLVPQFLLMTALLRAIGVLGLLLVMLEWIGDWAESPSRLLGAFGATLCVVVVFGIAIPNAWAKYCGEYLIVRLLPVLSFLRVVCFPLIVAMEVFDPVIRRLAGVPAYDAQARAKDLEHDLMSAVLEMEREGTVDEEEKEMIESVIELRDTLVEQIMTPRTDVVGISKDSTLDEIKVLIRDKGHSRIPVYSETIDTVLGAVYAKDLLHVHADEPFDITKVMRKIPFIPESKHVRDLLHEFQEQKSHMAMVLDEYGGTAGLVTIEDILEELVGEIVDEYETTEPSSIKRIDDHTVEVDARMHIDDLNDELDIQLPEDGDYETIGGFVFSTLGKVPRVGEQCSHENIAIQVIDAEPRRVKRLRLHITPPTETPSP